MNPLPPIAIRSSLPCDVPAGGTAVLIDAGRYPESSEIPGISQPSDNQDTRNLPRFRVSYQIPGVFDGPAHLDPARWLGRDLVAVLFPATALRLSLAIANLRCADEVRIDLSVTLALRIEDPLRFLTDIVRDAPTLTHDDLAALLRDAIRTSLAPAIRPLRLDELNTDHDLPQWLAAAIRYGLGEGGADLLGRSGLAILAVEAYDAQCPTRDEEGHPGPPHHLGQGESIPGFPHSGEDDSPRPENSQRPEVGGQRPEGARVFIGRGAVPDAEAANRGSSTRQEEEGLPRFPQSGLATPPPSLLRPELWRRRLPAALHTAPLVADGRVYCVTQDSAVHAFAAADGAPAWPQPLPLGTIPADGMALAGGSLWIPGHNGTFYGVDPATGTLRHRLPIGGKLSSAPIAAGDTLYLSVDVLWPPREVDGHARSGDIVAIDTARGAVRATWHVSQHPLRAHPTLSGHTLYVGDRPGQLYAVDTRRGRVEPLPMPAHSGGIVGAALDDAAHGQVIVGTSYGFLVAFDRAGRVRWQQRIQGAVVGEPRLLGGLLIVGAGDGRVYALDPANGTPRREPFATAGPIATAPVPWEKLAFIGSNDGYLYALDATTGACFWRYHSGHPIAVAPAIDSDGHLYVVDSAGYFNALRWCLACYAEGAQRLQSAQPPRWAEAAELWLLAGEAQAALEAARRAQRGDLVAAITSGLGWHAQAAQAYVELAQKARGSEKAAPYWAAAAVAWDREGQEAEAARCRLEDARARQAPLLTLTAANLPQLQIGQPDVVQVRIANLTEAPAYAVTLAYRGHVRRAAERSLANIGPRAERIEEIAVVPTQSGSATLEITVRYADARGQPQTPVDLDVRLQVARPPEVHHHYYGPVVGGDGVIIMRGERGRHLRVQDGGEALELGAQARCPHCGATIQPDDRFCNQCRAKLAG